MVFIQFHAKQRVCKEYERHYGTNQRTFACYWECEQRDKLLPK